MQRVVFVVEPAALLVAAQYRLEQDDRVRRGANGALGHGMILARTNCVDGVPNLDKMGT